MMIPARLLAVGLLALASFSGDAARAETVMVEYHGAVSLAGFDCPALRPSSFVNRICYDADSRYLIVQLGDRHYHYCGIPTGAVSAWVQASSLGRHYNANIRGRYACR